MTKQILAVAAALLFTTLAPAPSHAQQLTQAKVPFAFQAGSKMMPAGEYQVQRAFMHAMSTQLIRNTDSSAARSSWRTPLVPATRTPIPG